MLPPLLTKAISEASSTVALLHRDSGGSLSQGAGTSYAVSHAVQISCRAPPTPPDCLDGDQACLLVSANSLPSSVAWVFYFFLCDSCCCFVILCDSRCNDLGYVNPIPNTDTQTWAWSLHALLFLRFGRGMARLSFQCFHQLLHHHLTPQSM